MDASTPERVMAFEHRFTRAQASDVIELPFGYAVLQHEFPLSHYHNRLVVTSAAEPDQVLAAADEVLGGADRGHRFVSVDERVVGDLAPVFERAGYDHEIDATMVDGQPTAGADRSDETTPPVEVVSLDVVRPAIIDDWRAELPAASDEELRQLADRTVLSERGADLLRLAIREGGRVVARADLYLDRVDQLAQFESLVTSPDHRGQGHGTALLNHARIQGQWAGCDLLVLTADVADWPHGWYRRAGFEDVARWHHLSRRAS